MNKYKFDITWQTRCRGVVRPVIEAENEEEAREILEDTLEIDFNSCIRDDTDWDIDSVEVLKDE